MTHQGPPWLLNAPRPCRPRNAPPQLPEDPKISQGLPRPPGPPKSPRAQIPKVSQSPLGSSSSPKTSPRPQASLSIFNPPGGSLCIALFWDVQLGSPGSESNWSAAHSTVCGWSWADLWGAPSGSCDREAQSSGVRHGCLQPWAPRSGTKGLAQVGTPRWVPCRGLRAGSEC